MTYTKFIIFFCSVIFCWGILSCSIDSKINQTWTFDDVLFDEMSQNWEKAAINNYEFEYSISDVIPDSIIGNVTVINGIGTVELTLSGLKSGDKDYDSELEHYSKRKIAFKTIDELYDFIKQTLETRKTSYENEELLTYKLNISYDKQTFIPLSINEDFFYSEQSNKENSDGLWDGALDIEINKFTK